MKDQGKSLKMKTKKNKQKTKEIAMTLE